MISRIYQAIAKRHWWVISLVIFLIIIMEAMESRPSANDLTHFVETLIYVLSFLSLGMLTDELRKTNRAQQRTLRILDYKHRLNHKLSSYDNWEDLTMAVAQIPSKLIAITESSLFFRYHPDDHLELVAYWNDRGSQAFSPHIVQACSFCDQKMGDSQFGPCLALQADPSNLSYREYYCMPLFYGNELFASLRFKLKSVEALNAELISIFESICDELALTLRAGFERKLNAEARVREASRAERRTVSIYLHDSLGQNLSFLRLKIDQLIAENERLDAASRMRDLEKMREAASDSYEIVRNTLEKNYPKTIPFLDKLISEQTQKWSKRSNLEIHVTHQGQPAPITSDVQRAVFYVFQEAFNNIEKHACASKVDICLNWSEKNVTLQVTDNGIGFDVQAVDSRKHFGLEIMRERIENVAGEFLVETVHDGGTTIKISVPVKKVDLN